MSKTSGKGRVDGYTIHVSKDDLMKAPEMERVFFVLLGQFGNEPMILNKIMLAVSNVPEKPGPEASGVTVQMTLMMKLLMSKFHEAWVRIFNHIYFDEKLCDTYERNLTQEALKALTGLTKYFGKNAQLVAALRNSFGFHYDRAKLLAALPDVSADEEWHLYLSQYNGNSLYYLSEMIAGHALLKEVNQNDSMAAMKKLYGDCNHLTGYFLKVVPELMYVFMSRHLKVGDLHTQPKFSLEVPMLRDITLPYFTDPSDYDPRN